MNSLIAALHWLWPGIVIAAVFAAVPVSDAARARLTEFAGDDDRAFRFAHKAATRRYLPIVGYLMAMEQLKRMVESGRTMEALEAANDRTKQRY